MSSYDFLDYAMAGRRSLDSCLVMLAAAQRGLVLTYRPGRELRVSDGKKQVRFLGSGEMDLNREARAVCKNKLRARRRFERDGVSCPKGFLYDKNSRTPISYAESAAKVGREKLVVKPVRGRKGKGVTTEIASENELKLAISNLESDEILVEAQIEGEEYRCYVVGDEVVAVTGRDKPNVIGDGLSSIEELINIKNKERLGNPHLSTRKIKVTSNVVRYLESQGLDLESVPSCGAKIYLSTVSNLSLGADSFDALDVLPEVAKKNAVEALKSTGIMHGGVDIIVEEIDGDVNSFCLEVNALANIGSHSFPMRGKANNLVAEKIISCYFGEDKKARKDMFFDFSYVRKCSQSPFFDKVVISPSGFQDEDITKVKPAIEAFYKARIKVYGEVQGVGYRRWAKGYCEAAGLDGWVKNTSDGFLEAYVSGTKEKFQKFLEDIVVGPARAKVEGLELFATRRRIGSGFKIVRKKAKKIEPESEVIASGNTFLVQ